MTATADTRGLKRACACGTRFYDFNKRPILCPSCNAEFSGELKLKARRGRVAVIEAAPEVARPAPGDEGIEQVERDENLISLEDVEEGKDDEDEDSEALDIEGAGEIEDLEDIEEDLEAKDLEVKVEKE